MSSLHPALIVALAVVGAVALGLVAIIVRLRRLPLTPVQRLFYALNVALTRLLWRTQVSGPLPLAEGQGAIIISNHRSPVDPAFLQIATGRVIHWMVAKEYVERRTLGWFFRMYESIPVGRGGIDTAATKLAIRLAEQGELVGMFPEGRINTTEEVLLPGRPGVAMIALKARVPIIPCYIHGAPYRGRIWDPFVTPARVRVAIGRPIDLSPYYGRDTDREVLEEITRSMLREIARLAGREDFQPQLAGRFYKPGLDENGREVPGGGQ